MVAIKITSPEKAAAGFMLLVRQGRLRTLRGEVYVCNESALHVLDENNIPYEKVPLPLKLDELDALRDTPTTVL